MHGLGPGSSVCMHSKNHDATPGPRAGLAVASRQYRVCCFFFVRGVCVYREIGTDNVGRTELLVNSVGLRHDIRRVMAPDRQHLLASTSRRQSSLPKVNLHRYPNTKARCLVTVVNYLAVPLPGFSCARLGHGMGVIAGRRVRWQVIGICVGRGSPDSMNEPGTRMCLSGHFFFLCESGVPPIAN
jgi:hypothetical protein